MPPTLPYGLRSRLGAIGRPTRRIEVTMLAQGDPFPLLTVSLPSAGKLAIEDAFAGRFGVLLLYRGAWCPYCRSQLRGYQRAQNDLAALGARTVAVSTDDEATTLATIDKYALTFPVGHSADAHAINALTGAMLNDDPAYLHATGFIIDPAGRVAVSVYSSGAIGRLLAEDAVVMIRFLRDRAASD